MKTIFVSSTFKDMQFERDAIREFVAPLLNSEARKHNDEFDFCDLRWGINTDLLDQEESSNKVLNVCLDEIDRCQPPMIVLIGYRYGWIPDQALIDMAAERKNLQLDDLEKSVTALEIEYGSLSNQDRFRNTLFYFREIEGSASSDYLSEDSYHAKKVEELKERILSMGNGKVKKYTLRWNDGGIEGLQQFAEMLVSDIKNLLTPQWQLTEKMTPYEREKYKHLDYIANKANLFYARQDDADRIINEIVNNPVTIIKGEPGSGKSTLFSHLYNRFSDSDWTVFPYVSGLTVNSTDAFSILRGLVYDLEYTMGIEEHYTGNDKEYSKNISGWKKRLTELCEDYTGNGKKILIMLDAADQLSENEARDHLVFIPYNVNKSIHFVMTCTPDLKTLWYDFIELKELDDISK